MPEQWTAEQITAFNEIKMRLKSAPVLASPRLGSPYIIETDASLRGIAATLLQADNAKAEHPIVFASQTLKRHQRNYHINELEALAVVFGLKQFRAYVEGSGKITVRSDNSVICAKFFKQKGPLTGRMAKFILEMQGYELNFEHRKGKLNAFCDYVSRYVNVVSDTSKNEIQVSSEKGDEKIDRERICVEQEKEFAKVINWLKNYKGGLPSGEQSEWKKFVWQNGMLCWQSDEEGEDYKVVLPYSLRESMMKTYHDNPYIGAHLGVKRTFEKLKRRFYWPKMEKDITDYVKSCPVCQVIKNPTRPVNQPLTISKKGSQPFEHIHLDIMGPLELSLSKRQYIIVVVYSFSKFVVADAVKDQKARTIAKILVNCVFTKSGCPKVIATDQGRQLMGEVFTALGELMGFTHWPTTPYHQSANGQVERGNQTIRKMLDSYARSNPRHWDENVQQIVFAYNNSINSVTYETPFFLTHGWDPLLPMDIALKIGQNDVDPDLGEFKRELARKVREAWEVAKVNIEKEQMSQKAHYDKKRAAVSGVQKVQIGDLVLVKVEIVGKLDDRWTGPYRVVAVNKPNVSLIMNGKPKNVHLDKTKKYFERSVLPLRQVGEKLRIVKPKLGDKNLEESESE